jgi:hypothetical protein
MCAWFERMSKYAADRTSRPDSYRDGISVGPSRASNRKVSAQIFHSASLITVIPNEAWKVRGREESPSYGMRKKRMMNVVIKKNKNL